MNAQSRAQRAASFRLVAAFLDRDGAAVDTILQGRSVGDLAEMLTCLAGLAEVTTWVVAAVGAEPTADGETQRRVVDLVTEVTGPADGAATHLLWEAFKAGEPPAVLASSPAVAVKFLAACTAIAGEDWGA